MTPATTVAGPSGDARHDDLEGYDALAALARDVHWSWSHGADALWRRLDPELWEATQNPWVVLQTVSRERLRGLLTEPDFQKALEECRIAEQRLETTPTWFGQHHPSSPLNRVGYFSMEFMLSEALPIYSGGLGNVAGDQLKAASDLGVPVVGVGLLYQQGYFRQVIAEDGTQQALYPYNDPGQLPITPVRTTGGEWLRLELVLPGGPVRLRAWQVQVGRVRLYLLDTNDAANSPAHRGITSELYGGGPELRLQQEMVLGIGGWRLLEALGIAPEVCHLNEGHAAFAVLERARNYSQKAGQPFDVALAVTRAGNLFTTHTAVAAGFDRYPPALLRQYLAEYAATVGVPFEELAALGRRDPDDASEEFNMAYLAVRGSYAVNAVSRLHGQVSRALFAPLFPRWPLEEVPIGHVTNGIHVPTWDSAAADELWTERCGKDRWRAASASPGDDIRGASDARLWELRVTSRRTLVDDVRKRCSRQMAAGGASLEALEEAKTVLDPDVLTLGFARRFASYKRPDLLLRDPERLARLLTNPERPMQLVLAGKAHPADLGGQALIRRWISFLQRPEVRRRAVFLSDYDMRLTGQMVAGVDVWLNTPRRPWEACGTSGMKVLVNGGLNFSELDGWWAEAYTPEVGWSLGDGAEHGDEGAWDEAEAGALYDRLEQEVIPEFYRRDGAGFPTAWTARMRASMSRLTPQFSADRAVKDYTEQFYLTAATAYQKRITDHGTLARELVDWRLQLEEKWPTIQFRDLTVETRNGQHFFEAQLTLGNLAPGMVRVELYADGIQGSIPFRQEMTLRGPQANAPDCFIYSAAVSANWVVSDYTARVIPHHEDAVVPLEANLILWQR